MAKGGGGWDGFWLVMAVALGATGIAMWTEALKKKPVRRWPCPACGAPVDSGTIICPTCSSKLAWPT